MMGRTKGGSLHRMPSFFGARVCLVVHLSVGQVSLDVAFVQLRRGYECYMLTMSVVLSMHLPVLSFAAARAITTAVSKF